MPDKDEKKVQPSAEELLERALDLIRKTTTMALATTNGKEAWAAPVYYVLFNGAFYFFSSPKARHIEESERFPKASATLYPQVESWKDIRGLQMTGRIRQVSPGLTALKVIRAYLKKYPFTKEFFEAGEDFDLAAFSKRFRVRLYAFEPDLAYYLDNHIRFGFREEVDLTGLGE